MTTNKLLTATGDELSRVLGEIFLDEDPRHSVNQTGSMCMRCHIGFRWTGTDKSGLCSAKNRIPLTWESAMAWRDWAVGEYGEAMFMENLLYAMVDDGLLSPKESRTEIISGIVAKTQPEHYLKAAAKCKLKQDKE